MCSVWGCGISPAEYAFRTAEKQGWHPVRFETALFSLTGFIKHRSEDNKEWVVYIEGDGSAWKNRHTLSDDPTPRDPTGLRLALLDPAPNILYLARPGQYSETSSPECDPAYWSDRRYAPELIRTFNNILDKFRAKHDIKKYGLIGFSGGGTLAALLAAFRSDISWLVTVCANLDHAAWTAYHGVSPLVHSLNPADFTDKLQLIPQIHFAGEKDSIVPETVIRSYRKRMSDPAFTKIAVIPGYGHHCCWTKNWKQLQTKQNAVIK
ncbi:MAG: hypothetical protein V2I97_01680 [Desulfococcaceae bacterium]|jgi:pimeloyl-ACP methyl ester carboxylesterase|nr:hypothetical protein [Desulfococcaceae bacterium]